MTRGPENKVESHLVEKIQIRGGEAHKLTITGRRGASDRLVLLPIRDPEHQAIVAKYIRFVECKAPGHTLRQIQEVWRRRIAELGFSADTVASVAAVNKLVEDL